MRILRWRRRITSSSIKLSPSLLQVPMSRRFAIVRVFAIAHLCGSSRMQRLRMQRSRWKKESCCLTAPYFGLLVEREALDTPAPGTLSVDMASDVWSWRGGRAFLPGSNGGAISFGKILSGRRFGQSNFWKQTEPRYEFPLRHLLTRRHYGRNWLKFIRSGDR